MQPSRAACLSLLIICLVTASLPCVAQVVSATLPAGTGSFSAAVNSATNTAYVANISCPSSPCISPATVTVINGSTNNTTSVNVGVYPYAVAVNSTTNTIFVVNYCGSDANCNSAGTVSVINGASNTVLATVTVGYYPDAVAVNSATNKIYVANICGNDSTCNSPGTVTVLDGNNNYSTATVTAGVYPYAVAANPTTNRIYVANDTCPNYPNCGSAGTVTVINGNNNSTATVNVGVSSDYLAVDTVTNKIYVSNDCGTDVNCASLGTVTVIDGATNNTTAVNVGAYPLDIAVNSVTNQAYVADNCGNDITCSSLGTATVIDGNNNYSTTTVNVGRYPVFLDIDTSANKIYVANTCGNDPNCQSAGTVTVIDGATNSTLPIAVGDEPDGLAADSSTHTIYVPNYLDNTVSIIGGATKLQFVSIPPCRVVDTRGAMGPFGGPIMQGNTTRNFALPSSPGFNCPSGFMIPSTAAAYSLNVTVVPQKTLSYLTIWPTPQVQPVVSTLNSTDGRVKANAAIVPAGVSGGVSVYVTNTTHVILDIDGYFAPSSPQTYEFYSLTPCRVVDTRPGSKQPQGLGPPSFAAMESRELPILSSPCFQGLPMQPQAYSFNVTVTPSPHGQLLGYLTIWPSNLTQPVVSTLNNPTATGVANAAIVPADPSNGDVSVFTYNSTDVIIDTNGYFAAAGTGGLSMYPAVPCRVLDTRQNNGAPFMGDKTVPVLSSICTPPVTAQSYIFNATVVPPGSMPYLTLWADGKGQPTVSTLNAYDGFITSNMAIVPTTNGSIDAYAAGLTQLILDISGSFAP